MPRTQDSPPAGNFFELERVYPDDEAYARYGRLVGIDEHKSRLLIDLEMLLYPDRLFAWSRRHHGDHVLRLCDTYRDRVPLIILEGDVGTGKTALAETIGDALARRVGAGATVRLLKINTRIRGGGHVGEMGELISQAFTQAEQQAARDGDPVVLLIDEADALAARRDTEQMHHEDKAGLNTLLQRLDNLRLLCLPIAAIFITNRPDALDPAIRRRAALDLHFERPNDETRGRLIEDRLPELKITRQRVEEIVRLTGEREPKNKGVPFTASDITDRVLPNALREAYAQDRPLRVEDVIEQARVLAPTPRMSTS